MWNREFDHQYDTRRQLDFNPSSIISCVQGLHQLHHIGSLIAHGQHANMNTHLGQSSAGGLFRRTQVKLLCVPGTNAIAVGMGSWSASTKLRQTAHRAIEDSRDDGDIGPTVKLCRYHRLAIND